MALGLAHDYAEGKRTKDPKVIAKYRAAIAAWDALRAKAKADN